MPWSRWHSGPRVGRSLEASRKLHELTTQAIAEGHSAQAAIARKATSMKLPNLSGVSPAIDKLTSAIEDDAKSILDKVEALHDKRKRVFSKANERADARNAALDAADEALDKLDAALGDNGGPTLGDSSESPKEQ
jgi:hypothetical protein